MRVAIFSESYLPYLSGVTVSVDTLARGLGALGHEVLVVAPRPSGDGDRAMAGARDTAGGTTGIGQDPVVAWLPSYHVPPAPPGYRMPLPVSSAALSRAIAFDPDVVHAHSPFVSGLMARAVARRTRTPLVFTHHTRFADYGHYLGPAAGVSRRVVGAWLEAWWAGCAAVVAPTEDLAREIRAALGTRQRPIVRVIPTGIDVGAIAALPEGHPRRLAGWRPGVDIVLVSLGRVAREKSVDVLVNAFVRAGRRRPRLRLMLVGGGPAEEEVRARAAAAGVAHRVHVTGRLPRDEALALVKAGDVFIFASQTETQGLVLAEALAAGLPVVAVDGPGVAATLRDGVDAVLVPADPPATRGQRLGDAAGALAADQPRRERMAARAVEGATRFDARTLVTQVADLYRDVRAARH